jgi:RNA polymerase sigma factor (sigma-70 family)
MIQTMPRDADQSLETRPSLLRRLKSGNDIDGWQDFYRIYGGLIRSFAQKAGLTAEEAEDVVQETAIGLAKGLPDYVYDPKTCRFKTWLLNLTRWRIQNQLRRRQPTVASVALQSTLASSHPSPDATQTATIERIPDPSQPAFGSEWDAAWERNLLLEALERVRPRLDERHYQAFDLYVIKQWPPTDVAKTVGISTAQVYLLKYRVSALLKKEVELLLAQIQTRVALVIQTPKTLRTNSRLRR